MSASAHYKVGSTGAAVPMEAWAHKSAGSAGSAAASPPAFGKAASMLLVGGSAQTDALVSTGLVAQPQVHAATAVKVDEKAVRTLFYNAAEVVAAFQMPDYDTSIFKRTADDFVAAIGRAQVHPNRAQPKTKIPTKDIPAKLSADLRLFLSIKWLEALPQYVGVPSEISDKINLLVLDMMPEKIVITASGKIFRDVYPMAETWASSARSLMQALDAIKS